MNTLDVVVGGQFGSESKGRVTAELAARRRQRGQAVTGVRVAGSNAGHVVIDPRTGERFALRQVPVALVSDPLSIGVIAAGSEIDVEVLNQEVEDLERGGVAVRDRLLIDTQATILTPGHRAIEGGNDGPMQNRIGSTGKGVGAARADRIMRKAPIAQDVSELRELGHLTADTSRILNELLRDRQSNASVMIEGTQGFGLGLHAGYYPYCTSSDCRAVDFLSMAGIHPIGGGRREHRAFNFNTWVVLRAYPIRVAGNSGPLSSETSWEELGLPEERTTVTKKVRRVGHWDADLAKRAVAANGGPVARIALAMADQRFSQIAGLTHWDEIAPEDRGAVADWLDQVEADSGASVHCIGTGPATTMWLPKDARTVPQPWHHDWAKDEAEVQS